jgi:hypothetical protein
LSVTPPPRSCEPSIAGIEYLPPTPAPSLPLLLPAVTPTEALWPFSKVTWIVPPTATSLVVLSDDALGASATKSTLVTP